MVVGLGLGESKFLEDQEQHLEVVLLLVAHGVHLAVEVGEVGKSEDGCADVLGHVNCGAVAPEKEFFVQAVVGEVHPDGAVLFLKEHPVDQALLHMLFAKEVGVRLVVELVERHAHGVVGLVEAFVHPAVHGFPQRHDLFVAFFPALQHRAGFLQHGAGGFGFFGVESIGHAFCHFRLERLVERDVVPAHKLVALFTGRCRRLTMSQFLPSHHGLADVDAAVVDDLDFLDVVAGGLEDAGHAVAQEVVPEVAQVQRFVGVGRAVFHHHLRLGACGSMAPIGKGQRLLERGVPARVGQGKVQESFHHVEAGNPVARFGEGLSQRFGGDMRGRPSHACEGEHHQGAVAFKLGAGRLDLNLTVSGALAKGGFEGVKDGLVKPCVNAVNHACASLVWAGQGRWTSAIMQRAEPPPQVSM